MSRLLGCLLAVLLLGTACSDSGDPSADPSTPESTAATSESTTAPSESPEPTVEPATGPKLDKLKLFSTRAPEGWKVLDQLIPQQQEAADDDTSSILMLAETENFAGRALTLDELVDIVARPGVWSKRPKVLPTVELGGVEAYHLAGQVERTTYLEEFGVSTEDRLVAVIFQFSPEFPADERRALVDSVIASFEWK